MGIGKGNIRFVVHCDMPHRQAANAEHVEEVRDMKDWCLHRSVCRHVKLTAFSIDSDHTLSERSGLSCD